MEYGEKKTKPISNRSKGRTITGFVQKKRCQTSLNQSLSPCSGGGDSSPYEGALEPGPGKATEPLGFVHSERSYYLGFGGEEELNLPGASQVWNLSKSIYLASLRIQSFPF